ncbi:MAG TPA: hypothetical protein VJT09_02530 [Pyrinomonadaceae bacterium]|nr:hypothetical protein [Pyrinomonadaceae bacterium]
MRTVLVILIVCLAALFQINCASGKKQPAAGGQSQSATSGPATPVTAEVLVEAYRRNEATADGEYKGKTLAVTGKVVRSGKDYLNRLYVNLKAEDNPIIEVHCTYNDTEADSMSALKEGQPVTIRGVCEGKLSTWITLKDSVVQ